MNHAIAAGHQSTLETANEILKAGGNAVDAAIAAYWVMCISEPCMASTGAGGFALVHMDQEVKALDFFCQTPLKKRPVSELEFYGVDVDFGNAIETFHVGKAASAVPGAVAGMFELHHRWASIPMKDLASIAIEKAKTGITLDRFQAQDFGLLKEIFAIDQEHRHLFFNDTQIKQEGDLIKLPRFSDFLEALVHEGKELFYRGEIAASIAADYKKGGILTREDFEHYQVHVTDPYGILLGEKMLHTMPTPSVGGMIMLQVINALQTLFQSKMIAPFSHEHFVHLKDILKEVYQLSKDDQELLFRTQELLKLSITPNYTSNQSKGTSHFSIVDNKGNAVALTTSIGEGNGYFIPGTDMQMNNMLGEEALLPKGFHQWDTNTRLRSMMCPSIITDKNHRLQTVIGSGGAGRIPYVIAQTLFNIHLLNMDVQEAIQAPRMYYDGSIVQVESGFDTEMQDANLWDYQSLYFGGTNTINYEKGKYSAVGDNRRYAVGLDKG